MSDIRQRILQAARLGYTARWLTVQLPEMTSLIRENYAASLKCPLDETVSFDAESEEELDDHALSFVYDNFKTDIETFAKETLA